MSKPVIFLAFANDKEDNARYLRELANEKRALEAVFQDKPCELIIKTDTTIEDIFDVFRRNKDNVVIFHYGGHADGYQLLLETPLVVKDANSGLNSPAHGEGLVAFLGSQKNLHLAFFNGCSTRQFGEQLMLAGVPAVLATDSSINDSVATELAINFYKQLVSGFALAQSFKDAVRQIVTRIGDKRGLFRKEANLQIENPYQLHLNKNYPNAKDWTLFGDNVATGEVGFTSQNINKTLIFPVYEAFARHEPDLLLSPDYKQKDEQKIANFVIETFPYPIGTHLRVLMANTPEMMRASTERLRKIAQTYRDSGHLLWIALLSQWWEAQHENAGFMLSVEAEEAIKQYFSAQPHEQAQLEEWKALLLLTESFKENGTPLFMPEIADIAQELANENAELTKAVANLHELHLRFLNNPTQGFLRLEETSAQANEDLGVLLKRLAYWINYRIFPIKEIFLKKIRTQKPLYMHKLVSLDNRAWEHSRDKTVAVPLFTDSYSVVLLKGKKLEDMSREVPSVLTLSPFLFDENAFIPNSVNSKLFVFKGLKNGEPYFHHLDEDKYIDINEDAMKEMRLLFAYFKQTCLNF